MAAGWMSPIGRMPRLFAVVAIGLSLFVTHPRVAMAHAWLLHTSPGDGAVLAAPPTIVQLYFSESIDLPVHALEIERPDGRAASFGPVAIAATNSGEMVAAFHGAATGSYVVSWKVISADSHPVWGTFRFSIGAPSAAPPPATGSESFARLAIALQALGRWLGFLGAALMIGPFVTWWTILGLAAATARAEQRRKAWDRVVGLAASGSLLVAAGVIIAVVAQMASLSDTWGQTLSLSALGEVFIGQLGYVLSTRIFVAVVAWGLCGVLLYLPAPSSGRPLPALAKTVAASGLLILLSSTLVAHAATTSPVALSIALDWIHLLAMAVWLGGLAALVRTLPTLVSPPDPAATPRGPNPSWLVLASIIPAFSRLAISCVAALAISGLYSAVRNIGTLDQLLTTDYGRALLVKMGLMTLALALASVHLLVLGPALRQVAAGQSPRISDLWPLFRPMVRIEASLLVGALLGAGVLAAQAPARQSGVPPPYAADQAPTTVQSVTAGGPHAVFAAHVGPVLVTLAIAPVRGGLSPVAVSLSGVDGTPANGTVSVLATPPPGSGAASVLAALAPQGGGQFGGVLDLSTSGRWSITVNARTVGEPPTALPFHLRLPLRPGIALVRRADHATNQLRSLSERQNVSAGEQVVHTTWQFQAPDRLHYLAQGDIETFRVGARRWDRHVGGHWQSSLLGPTETYRWPDSTYAGQAWDAEIVDMARVGGQDCEVVSFWQSVPNATFNLCVNPRNGRILEQSLLRPGAFEYDDYGQFDSTPAIVPPRP
ncbi:MAG TPA: copper resistance protein CopC [Chloroflexota bacterium]|jgi:copper transport protein